MIRRSICVKLLCLAAMFIFSGCGSKQESADIDAALPPDVTEVLQEIKEPEPTPTKEPELLPTVVPEPTLTMTPFPTPTKKPEPVPTATPIPMSTATPEPTPIPMSTATPEPTATPLPTPSEMPVPTDLPIGEETAGGHIIVLDAGHQRKGNYEKEPNGPGSDTMKAKVSSGTQGVSTGLAEYELTLQVALKLRDELTKRGYTVIMVRETHDVDISNVERAKIANEAGADAFLRIHANGSDNQNAKGVLTICQTSKNPYNAEWYKESKRLSELVLDEVASSTGAKKRSVWETDTMTGINWAMVPSTILEMGFMTNPEEDEQMATEEYQDKIVRGTADAIDLFFSEDEQ